MSKRKPRQQAVRRPVRSAPPASPAEVPDSVDVDAPVDAVMPRSWRRLGPDGQGGWQMIAELRQAADEVRRAEDKLAAAVMDARAAGKSWEAVGWSLGLTGEACRLRWRAADQVRSAAAAR
jgi:hypothetical protein